MFRRLFAGCAVALASLLGSTSVTGAVLYNNFGSGDSFQTNIGYTLDINNVQGVGFVAGGTGRVTSIDVGMSLVPGSPPQTLMLNLYSDVSNSIGTLLGLSSVTVSNSFGTLGTSTGIYANTPLLSSGQQYWLLALLPSDIGVAWNLNLSRFR